MNQINNTEIVNNTDCNSQSTNENHSLQSTRSITQFCKLSFRFLAILLSVAAFTFLPAQAQEQQVSEETSMLNTEKDRSGVEKLLTKGDIGIPNQYIVVFKDWAAGSLGKNSRSPKLSNEMAATYGGKVKNKYQYAINGYAAEMSEEEAFALSQDERVAYVEQNQVFSQTAAQYVSGWGWGLDRIDQSDRPLNGYYNYNNTGAGVNVYVIDSGIKGSHPDFGGRVALYRDFLGGDGQDCSGHGTHVAGTIGGATVGVAKRVRLFSLRALNCEGKTYTDSILKAVEWVTRYHVKPAVVNMSLGGGVSWSMDDAVIRSIRAGVTYVIAAGNDGIDANYTSPARVREAITVGASDPNDNLAFLYVKDGKNHFSNYGTALDLFAPGQNIWSTSIWNTNNGYQQLSGTSMAAPHVAGTAAIYLQYYPYATPAQVHYAIISTATTGRLRNIGTGSPNRLLDSLMQ